MLAAFIFRHSLEHKQLKCVGVEEISANLCVETAFFDIGKLNLRRKFLFFKHFHAIQNSVKL